MKKIKSTRDLKVNDVLRVYKQGFGYAVLSVIDVHDQFISAKADRDFLGRVEQGDILDAYFWADHGSSYEFKIEVLGHFSIDLQIIFFKHTAKISWSRERKCLEADVSIPFSFFVFDVNRTDRIFSSTRVKLKKGRIVKLGDREAVIRYRGSLEEGAFVKGRIPAGGAKIDVIGRIACSRERGGNTCLLTYMRLAERDREKLLDYIFTIYRE